MSYFQLKNATYPQLIIFQLKKRYLNLGISLCKNQNDRCVFNFSPIIEKTQKNKKIHIKKINLWLQRDLSLRGRILLAKGEGISRLS